MTRIAYDFGGKLFFAFKRDTEPQVNAVVRSLNQKLKCDVQLWPQGRAVDGCYEYVAKWFDAKAEVYREEMVVI